MNPIHEVESEFENDYSNRITFELP